MAFEFDQEKLYLYGLEWLTDETKWPPQPSIEKPMIEVKVPKIKVALNLVSNACCIEMARFSDLNKLVNSVSYVFRMTQKLGSRGCSSPSPSADERQASLNYLIKSQ